MKTVEEKEEDGVQTLDLSQENVKLEKGRDKTVGLFLDSVFLASLGWVGILRQQLMIGHDDAQRPHHLIVKVMVVAAASSSCHS